MLFLAIAAANATTTSTTLFAGDLPTPLFQAINELQRLVHQDSNYNHRDQLLNSGVHKAFVSLVQ